MPAGPVWVDIDGLILGVDPIHGQKTGAYLDQRENHRAVARFASDQEVLDVFSYAGGFSLTALRWGGARNVLAVDSSAEALSLARANADRNGLAIETRQGDAGNVMAELAREERRFGVVVCDPPKFASKSADVEGALRGYEYINRLAINLTASGGILATCSCSGLVSTELFLVMLAGAAEKDKRELRLVEVRSQSPDHPVSLSCPETAYLKCVIARVVD
jgi:23S rRNA (cytosine1962-C5)-methyltransferase